MSAASNACHYVRGSSKGGCTCLYLVPLWEVCAYSLLRMRDLIRYACLIRCCLIRYACATSYVAHAPYAAASYATHALLGVCSASFKFVSPRVSVYVFVCVWFGRTHAHTGQCLILFSSRKSGRSGAEEDRPIAFDPYLGVPLSLSLPPSFSIHPSLLFLHPSIAPSSPTYPRARTHTHTHSSRSPSRSLSLTQTHTGTGLAMESLAGCSDGSITAESLWNAV